MNLFKYRKYEIRERERERAKGKLSGLWFTGLFTWFSQSQVRKRLKHKTNFGFTLIELLIVIAIIGLLSSVVLASLNSARAKARDARRIANVNQVKLALEFYFDAFNYYPSIGAEGIGYDWSGLESLLTPYISKVPQDPSGASWHIIQYVRGPSDAYGINMRYEKSGYCKTGININIGWWGGGVPICQ